MRGCFWYLKFIRHRLIAFIIFLISPTLALASSDTISMFIGNICDYLSGDLARASAILITIYLGYRMMMGSLERLPFIFAIIGMGLIIGSAYYGKVILLGGM